VGTLDGKVAVITGAASGIGRACALAMANEGAAVTVADRNASGATEVAEQIRAAGGRALPVEVDVSVPDAVQAMIERTCAEFGGLDVLHNNAAVLDPDLRAGDTDVVTLDLAVWERTLAVNLTGPMLGCRYAIPEMIKRGGGSIINTSSAAAFAGDFIRCAYGTSKGGLNSLTVYVATAFGKDGIRCNAIAPGVILTPAMAALHTEASMAELAGHHVSSALGSPEDVAGAAVYLAGGASAFMTGQVLVLDGGFLAHLPTYAAALQRRQASTTGRAGT
jgi:NAD(P)-dependent dehydrogenase (short-subunit alcohol dehydrogenase family)